MLAFLFQPEVDWFLIDRAQVKFAAQRISQRHKQWTGTCVVPPCGNGLYKRLCHSGLLVRAKELYVGYR
jgi:hypothetical protein